MRIEFTVAGPAGRHDVAVTVAGSEPLRTVLPALRELCGAGADTPGWLHGRRLRDTGSLADSGLRRGAVLTFAAAVAASTAPELRLVHVVAGAVARNIALPRSGVSIGRDEQCDLVLADDRVSRRHARVTVGPSGVTVHDCGSTNGTRVDGAPVPPRGVDLGSGGLIRVGDSIVGVRAREAQQTAFVVPQDGALLLDRAPAAPPPPEAAVLDAAVPPARARPGRVQWLAALLPAAAGTALAVTMSSPIFLLMSALTPVLLVSTALGDRVHWRRQRRRDRGRLRQRRAVVADRVAVELAAETAARRAELPDAATLAEIVAVPGRRLWQRAGPGLVVRVGTGDEPARTRLRTGTDDVPAGTLFSVPHRVDLAAGPLGVAGPADTVRAIVRWLLVQLAVRYPPGDLRIVVLAANSTERWHWCRWLPQFASLGGPAAVTAMLARRRAGPADAERPEAWTLVVADAIDASAPAAVPDPAEHRVTAIWLAAAESELPAACRTVLIADGSPTCVVRDVTTGSSSALLIEGMHETDADDLARSLAPYRESVGGSELPDRCRLGDLLPELTGTADDARSAWATAPGGAATPIGVGAHGPLTVDLGRDGPHALVVGTTGSGKSELLRTLVLGMAVRHPPDEVAFVLVDYKGGAAFADLTRLPHTTDVVTDLDPTQTERMLRSLGAELRRRERLFAAAEVADLGGYRSRPRAEAIPRLVLVVDEFAELAAEHPHFVSGLVGVARRGRSLGVHLVLATQRPTAVSAEIRANTSLRIALRVVEPNDSLDVVGVPDAAGIAPERPGRAYVRIGDRIEQVQTARVVADPASTRPMVEALDVWRRSLTETRAARDDELRRAVELLIAAARDISPPRPPWLPRLPTRLPLLTGCAIGRLDLPDEQIQPELRLPASGGVLVVGRARSGRTTALVTTALSAAARHPPSELHLHVIDSDGRLAAALDGLPHLGSAVTSGVAPELVPRLLTRLAAPRPQRTLLLADDWDSTLGRCGDVAAVQWSDLLAQLVRMAGDDLLVAVTGGRSLLLPRVAGSFGTRLLLALDDTSDYSLAGIGGTGSGPPAAPDPGGGVRAPDGAVFRIASATDPRQVVHDLAAGRPAVTSALRLRPLPAAVELDALRTVPAAARGMLLGVGGDSAEPCVLDLVRHGGRLLVAGPARSGRSTALLTIVLEARRLGHDVAIWAPPRSALRERGRAVGARLLAATAARPDLVVLDDVETLETLDDELSELVTNWLRDGSALPLAAAVAGRSDELATGYHPVVAAVRRDRCGLLLRPSTLDGDLIGVRIDTPLASAPPGRGVLVGGPDYPVPMPVQVARAVPP